MINMSLSEAAQVVQGKCMPDAAEAMRFNGCGIDSRALHKDNLFIALSAARDGHDFVAAAAESGAIAAMVQRDPGVREPLPYLLVADCQNAMAKLATHWRSGFSLPVVAVTGSNGKTTVKTMLDMVLTSCGMRVLATEANLNNELGVPLTLFRLEEQHDCAVVEMGAAAVGDISYLATMAKPTVAVVTQCAPAHLQGFGSIESVARTKGEIFASLSAADTAVINVDDDWSDLWQSMAADANKLGFGLCKDADIGAERIKLHPNGSEFVLRTPDGSAQVKLGLPGRHNIMNALATAACAHALGFALADIAKALGADFATAAALSGRLRQLPGINNSLILDDSYNANPTSLKAALEVLQQYPMPRCLVLGEMAELGADSAAWHRQAGQWAAQYALDKLIAVGELAGLAAEEFSNAIVCLDEESLQSALRQLPDSATVLVKGSRCAGMERVVDKLRVAH